MTIFFISAGASGPFSGPYPEPLLPTARYLVQKGHRVVVCLAAAGRMPEVVELARLCSVVTAQGSNGSEKMGGPGPESRFPLRDGGFMSEVMIHVAHTHPDLIVAEQLQSAWYGSQVRKHFDIPVVLRLYHVESELCRKRLSETRNPFKKVSAWIDLQKAHRIEIGLYPSFETVLVDSEEQARLLATLSGDIRTVVIKAESDGGTGFEKFALSFANVSADRGKKRPTRSA